MNSGETLGLNAEPGQLETITECFRAAASQLVSARGREEFAQAQREYVLTVLARVEWEEAGLHEEYEEEYKADRWRASYNEGIDRVLLDGRRHWYYAPNEHGYEKWQHYIGTQVYPCINVKRGVPMPKSHYAAIEYLQTGQARWQSNRPQPRTYRRSA